MTMLVRGGMTTGTIGGAALPTNATTGQVLQWNGTAWVAATPSVSGTTPNATTSAPGLVQLAGDLAGSATAPTVAKINGAAPAPVATSGAYTDLTGRPALAPVATSGSYGDLTGRPLLAPVATSGAYTDLTGKPAVPAVSVLTSQFNTSSDTAQQAPLALTVAAGTYILDAYLLTATGSGSSVTINNNAASYGGRVTWLVDGATPTGTSLSGAGSNFPAYGAGLVSGSFAPTSTATLTVYLRSLTNGTAVALGPASWLRLTKVA